MLKLIFKILKTKLERLLTITGYKTYKNGRADLWYNLWKDKKFIDKEPESLER